MKLHAIGCGCPPPTAERHGSAFLLEVGDEMLMVDCGPATTYKMARMGIAPGRVERVFITHHHFDHNVDFPCFALCRWDLCRGDEPALKVYGPPPTASFVDRLLGPSGAFYEDRKGVMPRPAPKVAAHDVGPGLVAETDAWRATAERVHHVEPWLESLVFRFDTEEGSVLFTGDCGDCASLRAFAKGVDTLVIACAHRGAATTSPAISDVITGAAEAADIAAEAGAKRVVLTHASPGYLKAGRKEIAVGIVARACDGAIVFPEEMTTLDL